MASNSSLEYSIERAVKHYSSLFVLPSHRKLVFFTFLLCLVGSVVTLFLLNFSLSVIFLVLQFGFFLFLLSTISDFVIRQVFVKSDPIYNTRRCGALSMFSIFLWFGFLLLGSLLTRLQVGFWFDLSLIGFAAVCILRLIVFSSTSFAPYWKIIGASLTQPVVCLIPMFYVMYSMGYTFDSAMLLYVLIAVPISIFTAFTFTRIVDNVGSETLKIPTTTILKAFLANWMENLNTPVENLFENFGKEKTIDFSMLAFEADNHFQSVIVVSSVHPGPFKNVGSSLLPFMVQESLEKKLDCVVSVPHGLFGHEFDLSSQKQNEKVLNGLLTYADFSRFASEATSFVRTQRGVANASCQIFGDCAVLTLTLAPETTEDFPQEVGDFILEEVRKLELAHVVIINAHNSINKPFDVSSAVESLKEASLEALKNASKLKPSSFKVGAAKITPNEFSPEDGMGPGGICALTIRVGEQTCAYVTIDGNNMVSGLRETILDSLKELGVNMAEVLTTDTHTVNAIVMTQRGYHPLGEAIPREKLTDYIKLAVKEALNNLKPASVAWQIGTVSDVTVIGEKQIQEMTSLADKALQRAKKTAVPLFTAVGLLLIAVLAFL